RKQVELGFDVAAKFGAQIPPEAKQQALDKAVSLQSRIQSAVFGSLGAAAGTAVAAVILWGIFSLPRAQSTYTPGWSIVLDGGAPFLLGMIAQLALLPVTQNPNFSIGLGFLVPADTSPFLHLFLASASLFSLWAVYLIAVGHQIQRKQKSVTGALLLLGTLWL